MKAVRNAVALAILPVLLAASPAIDSAREDLERGRSREALAAADRILAASPDDPDAHEVAVAALVRMNRAGEAIRRLDAWAERSPADPRPLAMLAPVLAGRSRWAEVAALPGRLVGASREAAAEVARAAATALCRFGRWDDALPLARSLHDLATGSAFDDALYAVLEGDAPSALANLEEFLGGDASESWKDAAIAVVSDRIVAKNLDAFGPAHGRRWRVDPLSEMQENRLAESDIVLPSPLSKTRPRTPDDVRSRASEGTVRVEGIVLRTGHVVPIRVLSTPGSSFTRSALDALRGWRYEPARRNGEAIPVQLTVSVRFERS